MARQDQPTCSSTLVTLSLLLMVVSFAVAGYNPYEEVGLNMEKRATPTTNQKQMRNPIRMSLIKRTIEKRDIEKPTRAPSTLNPRVASVVVKGGPWEVAEEKQNIEKRAIEKRDLEKQAIEKRAMEKRAIEKQKIEKRAIEKREIEKRAIEKQKIEKRAMEKRGIEKQKIEKRAIEKREIEKRAIEKQKIEKRAMEKRAIEKQKIEKRNIEKSVIEKRNQGARNSGRAPSTLDFKKARSPVVTGKMAPVLVKGANSVLAKRQWGVLKGTKKVETTKFDLKIDVNDQGSSDF